MDTLSENTRRSSIQGQLLRLSARRLVAIYRREDTLWIADFIDGHGELMDAVTWFRFNCGTPTTAHARRRMALESAVPLSVDLVASIEHLHGLLAERNKALPECNPSTDGMQSKCMQG